jgi:hypothetical protein
MSETVINIAKVEHFHAGNAGYEALITEEVLRGADPEGLSETGYSGVPIEAGPETAPTDEEQIAVYSGIAERITEEEIAATARVDHLRNMMDHIDQTRKLEGFNTNDERTPKNLEASRRARHIEKVKAENSLKKACGTCALRDNCKLAFDLEAWMDVHPYKYPDKQRKRELRPGTARPVKATGYRNDFLRKLSSDPLVHCEPTKRAK